MISLKKMWGYSNYNPSDDKLLKLVAKELGKGVSRQFIVLHTYGSHFNYKERYPAEQAFFLPDMPVDAEVKYKDNLINAYDNSIRYTDNFLVRLIDMLREQHAIHCLHISLQTMEKIFSMTTGISFCMLHRYLPIIRYMCHSLLDVRQLPAEIPIVIGGRTSQ
mgnify:CR=1 FL=1